jgi:hypothetical protein
MINAVLSRLLRSEGTASLGYPIIKQQQATNAGMIINLARSMAVGDSAFLEAAGSVADAG